MFISGYQSDDVGTRDDESLDPTLSVETQEVLKVGFGQVQAFEGIKVRSPSSNPGTRGVGQRFPTASSGLRQLTQNIDLSQIP